MKLAIDAMGGDHAPKAIVDGVKQFVDRFPNEQMELFLVGDAVKLASYGLTDSRVTIVPASEVITGEDEPVRAVRRKKDSSLVVAAQLVKDGKADALVSAGNTGALMAVSLFVIGRIPGIERPALSPTFPTYTGSGVVILDVGANPDAKPEHLVDYAIMGSLYAEHVRGVSRPRVALLNIGTEAGKGNALTKEAFPLLEQAPVHFVGNVEAREAMSGDVDVIVTEGFAGNILLKGVEGSSSMLMKMMKEQFTSDVVSKLAALVLKPKLKKLKQTLDYREQGGAGLFGINAPVIKAHGSSDALAIMSALKQAKIMVEHDVVAKIKQATAKTAD
ncbi:MAG: phosphate acyltransferase PlsX [Exiguobacterium sp.]|uniref:Phosphate acyltransferase n=1 Tax=Exiguobacterium alkaliphilum TaxID=1428684 RepID=A0ABT2KWW7_9BACL|nr:MULTISPECIES: phosphate acyltransferase PlsX [Exiguobacterium]MDX5322337.1 phosphate acyltransferase PlsX [Exiguobacterium sp.]KDN57466.1 phosphate acyltransferase [Exiguobacterium sp. AB2]MCT4794930.1 phosphate acyltransferase PlsX [Exiguobacterium alkaliphilum]MDX5424059.1 phosphate acyltransferase PlsX [Exiguobacterium sp.]MDX6771584.1 phosphate acyltransferase PlsX [Exiguobacterium sp.]